MAVPAGYDSGGTETLVATTATNDAAHPCSVPAVPRAPRTNDPLPRRYGVS